MTFYIKHAYNVLVKIFSLQRPVHVSICVGVAAAGFVIGIALTPYVYGDWLCSYAWLGVGLVLTLAAFGRRTVVLLLAALIGGVLLGLWRGGVTQTLLEPYRELRGHVLRVRATIIDDPDKTEKEMTLTLSSIEVNEHTVEGKIWASVQPMRDAKRGDIVTVEGKMAEGFGSYRGSMYRAKLLKVERPNPGDIAGSARDWFAQRMRLAISEPEVSLGIGYLVGQRQGLPVELDEALKTAGLTHIVVASGYNLTILVRLARRLLLRFSKYIAGVASGGMVILFMLVTGFSPSMARAGLVAGLSLLAWYYGRKFHPLVLLTLVAASTLVIDPGYAWGDLGWQLSFAAFCGVMIVAPLAQSYFFGDVKPGMMRQILGETISAQLCTLPILVLAFGQFSNVAILANLLVLPLVSLAMLLSFIAGVGAILFPYFVDWFGAPADILLGYMIYVTKEVANIPWAQTTAEIVGWEVWAMYLVITISCFYMYRKTKFDLRKASVVE